MTTEEKVSVTIKLPKNIHGLLSELAQIAGRPLEDIIAETVEFDVRNTMLEDHEHLGEQLSDYLRKKYDVKIGENAN